MLEKDFFVQIHQWITDNLLDKNNDLIARKSESWIQQTFPHQYIEILTATNFLNTKSNSVLFKERLRCILLGISNIPKCKICSNEVHFVGKKNHYYNTYCSKACMGKDVEFIQNRQHSLLKNTQQKYGVENISQLQSVKQKKYIKLKGRKYPQQSGKHHHSRTKMTTDQCQMLENIDQLYQKHIDKKIPITIFSKQIGLGPSTLRNIFLQHGYKNQIFSNSYQERTLAQFLESFNIPFETNTRTILSKNKELDIYFPNHKLAIEINGLFWHNDQKQPKYHLLEKTKECKNLGIHLLHFFDIELDEKFPIVASMIQNFLQINTKIFARNCQIMEIDSKTAYNFYQQNHIQGGVYSRFNWGLIHEHKLMACLSISPARYGTNNQIYELTRFCNKININILGGFSKLLKNAINTTTPQRLVSYCDQRFFTGNSYTQFGFNLDHTTNPNYYYFRSDDYHLASRIKFQKHKLSHLLPNFDPNLSESQNMYNNGYYRIYDCGNKVFVL